MKQMIAALACALSLAVQADAQTTPYGEPNPLYVQNVIRHMAAKPFAPQFVPPGFSDAVATVERKAADAPLQAVIIRMKPESEVIYQLLAVSAAKDFLEKLGGVPMLGGQPYVAGKSENVEIQGLDANRHYTAQCWSGRDPSGGKPLREVCAVVMTPQVLLSARATGTAGATPDSLHSLAVSLISEGVAYWIAIDDEMGNDFLKGFVK